MNKPAALLSTLATVSLLFATTAPTAAFAAVAAVDDQDPAPPTAPVVAVDDEVPATAAVVAVDDEVPVPVPATAAGVVVDDEVPGATRAVAAHDEVPTVSAAPAPAPTSSHSLEVRLEGSLVGMRDAWLGLPGAEIGLTVGGDLTRSWSIELTGSAREPDSEARRSWSALAAARWVAVSSANGRHRFTLAGGPFVEVNNVVHGTMPFAHAEVAYVYRAPFGLTVLAGLGPNIALASSSYVTPPKVPCDNDGDAFVFCFDLGPDAQEIHAGDAIGQMRLAVGWQL